VELSPTDVVVVETVLIEVSVGDVSGDAPEVNVDELGVVEDDAPEIDVDTVIDDVDNGVDVTVEVGIEEVKHEEAGVPSTGGIETKQG
jgi:hypothetical protein